MRYAPYFCEENIWHLAGDPAVPKERYVVVVTGERGVAMWGQRAAAGRDPMVWDYHVFLIARDRQWQVWDLDTVFGLPITLDEYLDNAFKPVPPQIAPRFRVIEGDEFRTVFSSDRSHMIGSGQPFPTWARIGEGMGNLSRFIDMDDVFVGDVVDLRGLRAFFNHRGTEITEKKS
jgi:protein N-terminal glutamine amidohydrolase